MRRSRRRRLLELRKQCKLMSLLLPGCACLCHKEHRRPAQRDCMRARDHVLGNAETRASCVAPFCAISATHANTNSASGRRTHHAARGPDRLSREHKSPMRTFGRRKVMRPIRAAGGSEASAPRLLTSTAFARGVKPRKAKRSASARTMRAYVAEGLGDEGTRRITPSQKHERHNERGTARNRDTHMNTHADGAMRRCRLC